MALKRAFNAMVLGKMEMTPERKQEYQKDKERMKEDEMKQDNTWVTLYKRKYGGLFWNSLFYLQVSRPFLWLATLWLYALSTAVRFPFLLKTWTWWIGLFYMGWPVNFLQFAPNDYSDLETDRLNPRKRSFWTGGHFTRRELDTFPVVSFWSQVPFFILSYVLDGWTSVWYLVFAVFINVIYNHPNPKYAWRDIPILEMFGVLGFVPATPYGAQLNHVEHVGWATILPLCAFCFQLQLWGEVWDDESDRKAGRTNTTNQLIGLKGSQMVLNVICLAEGLWVWFQFDAKFLGAMGILTTLLQLWGWRVPRSQQRKLHMCTVNEYSFIIFSIWFFLVVPFYSFSM